MEKDLPKMVFNKFYENFYLYTEFDIIFNDKFYENLTLLIEKLDCERLIFRVIESNSLIISPDSNFEYLKPTKESLRAFYELQIGANGKQTKIFYLDHFLSDESQAWAIYVSLRHEIGIFACEDKIKSLFTSIFKPYTDISVNRLYKIIGDRYNDDRKKEEFLNELEKNYHFLRN